MPIKYYKLFDILNRRGISKTELRSVANITPATASKLFKGDGVSIDTIERICESLDLQPGDFMEYVPGGKTPEPPKPKDRETKSEAETEEKPKDSDADSFNPKDTFAAFGEEFELLAEEEIFKRVIDGETKYAIMPKDVARFLRELELKLTYALEPWDKEATEQKRERIFDMYYSLTIQRLEKFRTEGKIA